MMIAKMPMFLVLAGSTQVFFTLASSTALRGGDEMLSNATSAAGEALSTDGPALRGVDKGDIMLSNVTRVLGHEDQSGRSLQAIVDTWLHGGIDSFQECPGDKVVRGLCGSGRNKDCGPSYASTGCGDIPGTSASSYKTDDPEILVPPPPLDDYYYSDGWECNKWGVWADCAPGLVMVGACGSGQHEDCRTYCSPDRHAAIKCESLPGSYSVDSGKWSPAQGYGKQYTCGTDEVACGACLSGKNADCSGGWMRLKCCKVTKPKYRLVTTGTCKSAGYSYIYDSVTCREAAKQLGKTITWGPYGGLFPDVVQGCSVRDDSFLFLHWSCDPSSKLGEWTWTGCQCTDLHPCICQD